MLLSTGILVLFATLVGYLMPPLGTVLGGILLACNIQIWMGGSTVNHMLSLYWFLPATVGFFLGAWLGSTW